MKLAQLAQHLGAELRGDPALDITAVAAIESAGPGHISFVSNPRYAKYAATTRASALIVEPTFPDAPVATLRVKNPHHAYARALELLYTPPAYPPGIHPTAVIAQSAVIGARAHIGAYVVIGADVRIGDDAVILPHVVIYDGARIGHHLLAHAHAVVRERCQLGDHVILQNGVVIGADGFGFARLESPGPAGLWYKVPQAGSTALGNHVEVQANATIDRGSVGVTQVHDGAKIDNLVQIGHGSVIGENSLLCAQVGLAGSTIVGKNVILAGQVGTGGHLTIGDGVIATGQSGISHDIPAGKMVSGTLAIDNKQWLRCLALFNRLPELIKELRGRRDT
jgi:UDP-3-O-[3-hydroxymyristoyl] glucosamine N-acyltransferase